MRTAYTICLTASLMACGGESGTGAAASPPTFVGSDVCASCHQAEAELWRGSHHDLAMQDATPESVLGDFGGASHEGDGAVWTFVRRGRAFFAREVGPEGDGQAPESPRRLPEDPGNAPAGPRNQPVDHRVAYTFGAFPLQQYLVEFPGGRYQVLPIAWDSRPAADGGQRWFDVRAGERAQHWTGPDLTWNSMCAECHSTGLAKNYSPATNRFSTGWTELDVACEACHGPGSEHVAWVAAVAEGSAPSPAAADAADRGLLVHFEPHDPAGWTPDPATGTPLPRGDPGRDGQLDACSRCHARRTAITAGYLHGEPLLDTHQPALLADGLYFADGQIREEVYVWGSFVQSAMYRAGVTCIDCHEAHSLSVRGDEGNAVCTRCHAPARFDASAHHFHEAGTEAARCVSCHMPSRTYMGIDARRDHSFRVPAPEVADAVGAPDPCTSCHSGMTGSEAAAEIAGRLAGVPIRRTEHYAEAIASARQGDPRSLPGLYMLLRDPKAPAITRATALTLLGADPNPERVAAVRRGVGDPDPLVRMGALRGVRQAPAPELAAMAAPLLEDPVRAVRLAAVEAVAPSGLPAAARAVAEYREAQLASAERPESQLNLAWLATALGSPSDAERALETAISLDSAFVPAYVNLADLHFRAGRDPEGEPLLRSAIQLSPGSADAHHALGLLLVRSGRTGEAMAPLQRAAELDGQGTRYAYVYAVALQSAGDTAMARAVLERTLQGHPRDRDLLLALATLHRDEGRAAEALRYARELARAHPFDPAGPALVAELER